MKLQEIKTLFEYHCWANERNLAVIDGLSQEQYSRELVSSFPSLQATLAHMVHAEGIWLARMTGEPVPPVTPADVPTPAALRRCWDEMAARMRRLLDSLDDAALDRPVVARTSAGKELVTSLGQALQHLINHGSYHRGQVTTLLRQVGAAPVATDLIMFYRQRSGQL